MNFRIVVLSISLILITVFISTANVAFYNYGVENGLSESKILIISQDSRGFIWLAGENTLFRFDGNQFKDYRIGINSVKSQFNSKINCFYSGSNGVFWIGTENGFYKYNPVKDRFILEDEKWEHVNVSDIKEDRNGKLWISTDEGLASFDIEKLETTWYTSADTVKPDGHVVLPFSDIARISLQPDGKIWIHFRYTGLSLFDPVSGQITNFKSIDDNKIIEAVITNIEFTDKQLYISTVFKGLFSFDPVEDKIENQNFGNFGNTIHHFQHVGDSVTWLASNNGLIEYKQKTGEYRFYTQEALNPLSLTRTAIIHVFVDSDNNLWVSNGLKGINYGLNNVTFGHFQVSSSGANNLEYKEVTSMRFDKPGNMWIGYEAGFIEKLSYDQKTKKRYLIKNINSSSGSVMSIYIDSKNRIWAGGWQTGLLHLNEKSDNFERVNLKNDTYQNNLKTADIRGIIEDANGNLWITVHGLGIGCYNPEDGEIEIYRFNQANPSEGLSNDYTFDFCTDKNQNLWISTAYGVSRLNLTDKKFKSYFHIDGNRNSLSNNVINTIYCDAAGYVWAGTSNGLNLWQANTDSFTQIITTDDIPFLNISSIQSVKPGELWLSTGSGIVQLIYKVDENDGSVKSEFRYFGRSQGILSTSFFYRSAAVSNEGKLYFGGNESIDFFDPQETSEWEIPEAELLITEITIDGNPVDDENILNEKDKQAILLKYHNRMISIRFASLGFNEWRLKNFRYKLEGFQDEWIYPNLDQLATFTSLPAGKYRFLLEVQENSREWTSLKNPVYIVVKPPFWLTWYFILSVLVILILSIYMTHHYQTKRYIARQLELEKIIENRTFELVRKNEELDFANQTKNKFFSIISHDLRSPFSGLLGILDLLNDPEIDIAPEKKKELLKQGLKSAKNTFDLLDNLLSWARSQMHKNASNPQINNLSTLLAQNIELKMPTAANKGIVFKKHLPEKLDAFYDEEMINTVVRNLLSNALKFTKPGGMVEVSLSGWQEEAEVEIADTGIGMTEEEKLHMFDLGKNGRKGTMGERGTGLGLIICKEFIEKNKGKLWITQNQPQGTVFHFSLPLH